MLAAIYARISDDRTGDRAGVQRQEADCRAFCDARGWSVAEVLVDNDLSAYSRKRRPAYERLLEAVKGGAVDAVVVWHLDRLYRHPLELETIIELVEVTGLTVATVTGGDYDLTTTDGRAMARVIVTFARKESEDKSRRTIRKHAELAREGKAVGSGRPFGYEDDKVTLRLDEAELVRDAARRVLAGESLRSVCWDWNTAGVTTSRGNRWTQTALRRVLSSSRVAGLRSHGPDGPEFPAQWPAILDAAVHERLRQLLADPDRRVNWGFGPRKYLLTGLLFCGLCGTRLIAKAHQRRRRCYVCAAGPNVYGCGRLRIVAEPLEELVAGRIFEVLDSPAMTRAVEEVHDDGEDRALLDEIAVAEASLEQLARDHYADRLISRGEFIAARDTLERRLEAARRRLVRQAERSAASGLIGQGASLRERWASMSLHQRRGVVEAMVERVDIGSARPGVNRFDPERAPYEAFVWRL